MLDPSPDWWRSAVVYQVYPRSFADTDGDGIGNIAGITSKLDYLSTLGIDAIWLSPFYPSELADGGYDVADYRNVDPRLGTLADMDELIAKAHERGIRVMVDIVPNHSSDQHEWFQAALAAAPGSPERDRYIFRDGLGPNGDLPPSNWTATFGSSAWTRVPDGQWYLHLFAPEQPDFNWDNPEVVADFHATLRFWADRGVDGYRIDVANGLKKDLATPLRDVVDQEGAILAEEDGSHPFWDRDDVHEIYRGWRKVFDEYNPPRIAVAEAWVPHSRRGAYIRKDELNQAFNFDFLESPWEPLHLRKIIDESLAVTPGEISVTWVLSNHDVVRHPSRYALPSATRPELEAWLMTDGHDPKPDLALGTRRARAAILLEMALPGSMYIYQGEELGLPEVADLPASSLQDPVWANSGHTEKGRDGCRVPLPWTRSGSSFGFGSDGSWLPQPEWFGQYSVEAEDGDADSMLTLYRTAAALRRSFHSLTALTWERADDSVLCLRRDSGLVSLTNFGPTPVAVPAGELLLTSAPLEDGLVGSDTTVWVRG